MANINYQLQFRLDFSNVFYLIIFHLVFVLVLVLLLLLNSQIQPTIIILNHIPFIIPILMSYFIISIFQLVFIQYFHFTNSSIPIYFLILILLFISINLFRRSYYLKEFRTIQVNLFEFIIVQFFQKQILKIILHSLIFKLEKSNYLAVHIVIGFNNQYLILICFD